MTGTFVAIVGPSGAGKDALISYARDKLADKPGFLFAKRYITRPGDQAGEDHIAITPGAFAKQEASGQFILSWHAHDMDYAITSDMLRETANGQIVVANLSRTVLDRACELFASVKIFLVTARPDIIAQRLAERGRETSEDIKRRLARASLPLQQSSEIITIENNGLLSEAGEVFLAELNTLRRRAETALSA